MTCDPWAGLIPVEDGTGCVLRVQVGLAEGWEVVGLVTVCLAVMVGVALLITRLKP